MRILSCFVIAFCINAMASDDASAARRGSNGNGRVTQSQRYIEPNARFYETAINSRVGKNASPAAKYFAYLAMNGR
jgi:hypothetical protein